MSAAIMTIRGELRWRCQPVVIQDARGQSRDLRERVRGHDDSGRRPRRRCRNARSGAGEGGEVPAGEGGRPHQGGSPRCQHQGADRRGQVGDEDGSGLFPANEDVHLDWDSIDAMVQEGETGKIVEVEDEAEHKTIEVWLE